MDAEAIKRAQGVLTAKGVKVDASLVREAITAAETLPEPGIPVSQGMIAAGRKVWLANPTGPVHVLLSLLYRTMEQQRIDEEAAKKSKRIFLSEADEPALTLTP